jgi:hypothetical protein
MTIEQYKKAKVIVDEIDVTNYEIKNLKDNIEAKNDLIRFGGQFNVSIPIRIDKMFLDNFCLSVIQQKELQVEELQEQLKQL